MTGRRGVRHSRLDATAVLDAPGAAAPRAAPGRRVLHPGLASPNATPTDGAETRRARLVARHLAAYGDFTLWTMTKNRVVAWADVRRQTDGFELSISIAGEFTWARRYRNGAVLALVREADDQYFDFIRHGWRVGERAPSR